MFETTSHPVPETLAPDSLQRTAESRLDPLSGQWTIFAPQRNQRPDDFVDHSPSVKTDVKCPFCVGNEASTPKAVWSKLIPETANFSRMMDPAEDEWSVRVVPNKFPAVDPVHAIDSISGSSISGSSIGGSSTGRHAIRDSLLFRRDPIAGGHEVIIESTRHVHSLTQLDMAEVDLVFQAYRDRLNHYREIPGIQYASVFKNVGRQAGASLRHSHSQLVATDRIPKPVESSVERMRQHRATTGCCLRCDMIRAERKAKERLVACDDSVIAFCPFASPLPLLVRVTSIEHAGCFEELNDRTLECVARMVFRVVSWLEKIRPKTAYNICLNTRPPGITDPSDAFHWAIDIFPRMTQVAGFEWSSGCMINPVLPETAAAEYRKCVAAENPRRRV